MTNHAASIRLSPPIYQITSARHMNLLGLSGTTPFLKWSSISTAMLTVLYAKPATRANGILVQLVSPRRKRDAPIGVNPSPNNTAHEYDANHFIALRNHSFGRIEGEDPCHATYSSSTTGFHRTRGRDRIWCGTCHSRKRGISNTSQETWDCSDELASLCREVCRRTRA